MSERRFTDREVARIFERASRIDRDEPGGGGPEGEGRGLSLVQLKEIGREVGISEDRISRAVAELGRGGSPRLGGLLGPDARQGEIRSVPTRVDRPAIAELVRVVDERMPAQGTVTEALGSVRWSSSDRFLSRQVSIEPGDGETLVRVEERYTNRLRLVAQAMPAFYGGIFGLALGAESAGWIGVLVVTILTLAGWLLGRGIWSFASGKSAGRAHDLAEELAAMATRLGDAGESGPRAGNDDGAALPAGNGDAADD